jgi:hypothetical protein
LAQEKANNDQQQTSKASAEAEKVESVQLKKEEGQNQEISSEKSVLSSSSSFPAQFKSVDISSGGGGQKSLSAKFAPIQRQENKTGLPDNLKSGMENLSGHSMDDVKVHRNSDKPAQLNAHAYAQGTDIHLGPGQEKHLPHELGHVVQQKEGRVKPTKQMKGKVAVNDDAGLEKEADVLGAQAIKSDNKISQLKTIDSESTSVQLEGDKAHSTGAEKHAVSDSDKTADRKLNGDPLLHPLYPTFRGRLLTLFNEFPSSSLIAPEDMAIDIWRNMVEAVAITEGASKNKSLYKENGYEVKDLAGDAFAPILSAFNTTVNLLKPAASSQFVKAKKFGFWSKKGIVMAKKHADLTLETSGLGALFDGFPSITKTGENDWDFRIWPALSRGYAECVAEELKKPDKTVEIFTAGPIVEGNIWESIESKALELGAESAGYTMKEKATYHAVATTSKKGDIDESVQGNGAFYKGIWTSSKDRQVVLDSVNENYGKLAD